MISILIPSYDYNTLPLVKKLYSQVVSEGIAFEIIVQDDASPINENTEINSGINQLQYCSYHRNETTLGRGQNRNLLVSKAQFKWILFLDCDTFPKQEDFIKKYVDCLKAENTQAAFGGIAYYDQKPNPDEMLRWVYGKIREEISLERRIESPYKHSLISNFLIKKKLVEKFPFDTRLTKYGYEDIVLINDLRKNGIAIAQIENAAYHLQLENSARFLEKTKESLSNLKYLLDHKIFADDATSLVKTYKLISKVGLRSLAAFIFRKSEGFLIKNLLSKEPSLKLFLLYKLGYFCQLNTR